MKQRTVKVRGVALGGGSPLAVIAGPCVIESRGQCLALARRLSALARKERIPLIFKASYDKANRSSHLSFRGPGLARGLEILAEVQEVCGLPILTDVHSVAEVGPAATVADIIQIPAFLCRQTDLVVAAGKTGRVVNVKKGQFLAPWDVGNVLEKIESTGNRNILITERGASFGYNNLVADMRSLVLLRAYGYPVVFDATHSVQKPGAAGRHSGGDAHLAPCLARAAVAAGCDAVFLETYADGEEPLSDKENSIPFSRLRDLWRVLRKVHEVVS